MKVLFCHGLESGPHGTKFEALKAVGFEVLAPDCRGMDLEARVEVLVPLLRAHRPLVVGSSFGGVAAVLASMWAGVDLPGLVLCAPALGRATEPLDCVAPTVVVHGRADDVVPLAVSEGYVMTHPEVELKVVEDDHRLKASEAVIVDAVRELISTSGQS